MTTVEHYAVTKERVIWKCDLCMRVMRGEKDMTRIALRHFLGGGDGGKPVTRVTQWHLCWRCAFDLEDRMETMRRTQGAGVSLEEQAALLRDLDEPKKRRFGRKR